jgi:hypothetical protein
MIIRTANNTPDSPKIMRIASQKLKTAMSTPATAQQKATHPTAPINAITIRIIM